MPLFDPSRHCIIRTKPNADGDIHLFHGIFSQAKNLRIEQEALYSATNYNVIACDARGHGTRKKIGNVINWKESIDDMQQFIDSRNAPKTILIGHSMGSITAYNLAKRNPDRYDKVFLLSLPHNITVIDEMKKIDKIKYEKLKVPSIIKLFPSEQSNEYPRDNLYLIHGTRDQIIPFSQGKANQLYLNIPSERFLAVKQYSPFFTHSVFTSNPQVILYIADHIRGIH